MRNRSIKLENQSLKNGLIGFRQPLSPKSKESPFSTIYPKKQSDKLVYKFERLDQPYPITVQKSKVLAENFREYMDRMEAQPVDQKVGESAKLSPLKKPL